MSNKNSKKKLPVNPIEEKEFYSTQELVRQVWFPVKTVVTLKKLIEAGYLKAVDVSHSPKLKRYKIYKSSAEHFIRERSKLGIDLKPGRKKGKVYGRREKRA